MIKVNERVTHNGITYEPGTVINNISKSQSDRLVRLGVAFYFAETQVQQVDDKKGEQNPNDAPQNEELAQELETIEYTDLKDVAKEIGLEFAGNIAKKKLIALIIENGKAEEVLEQFEVEE